MVALLVACKPLQIKEFELETIPGLKGKVEKMVVTKIGYDSDSLNTDNAEFFRSVNTIFLNNENKIRRQEDLFVYPQENSTRSLLDCYPIYISYIWSVLQIITPALMSIHCP